MSPSSDRWNALCKHWGKDALLWVLVLATLQLFRIGMVLRFVPALGTLEPSDLGNALWMAARFDAVVASSVIMPSLLVGLLAAGGARDHWATRTRSLSGDLYAALACLAFAADYGFFRYMHDQFDHRIFDAYFDGPGAVLHDVWSGQQPLVLFFSAAVGCTVCSLGLRRWLRRDLAWFERLGRATTPAARFALFSCVVVVYLTLLRGGLLGQSPIRVYFAFVSKNLTLNRLVQNPFSALVNATEDVLTAKSGAALCEIWPSGDLNEAARVVGDAHATARGASHPPRHVVVVLMESQDGWPLLRAYRHADFAPGLSALAERGVYFPNMVQSGPSTFTTLGVLLTGMPELGLNVTFQRSAFSGYPTSMAAQFRQLGYRTRFFFGGYVGWRRLDLFVPSQGFDEVWSASNIPAADGGNHWGVRDDHLFEFVLSKLDDSAPTFDVIVTTTNHAPYDLDLSALGVKVPPLPEGVTASEADAATVLGHSLWAQTQVSELVRRAEQRLPHALFALTGDHVARSELLRFPGDDVFEHALVPLILYGSALPGPARELTTPASHLDIAPTLLELCAPAGFRYATFGSDLLQRPADGFALGYQWLVGESLLVLEAKPSFVFTHPSGMDPGPLTALAEQSRRFAAIKALSWQRIVGASTGTTDTTDRTKR